MSWVLNTLNKTHTINHDFNDLCSDDDDMIHKRDNNLFDT